MARQLSEQGFKVGLLAIIDQGPPNVAPRSWLWTPREIARFCENLIHWIEDDMLQSRPAHLLRRGRGKLRVFCQHIVRKLRGEQAAVDSIDIEQVFGVSDLPPRLLRIIQSTYGALAGYHPQKYAGRVDLFRTRTERLGRPHEPDYGWGALASGGVTIHILPGTHSSVVEEPNVRVLAEKLMACLREAQARAFGSAP